MRVSCFRDPQAALSFCSTGQLKQFYTYLSTYLEHMQRNRLSFSPSLSLYSRSKNTVRQKRSCALRIAVIRGQAFVVSIGVCTV